MTEALRFVFLAWRAYWRAKETAVGPGRWKKHNVERIPMVLKPGDRVMVPLLNFPMDMDGETVYITNETTVFGIVAEDTR